MRTLLRVANLELRLQFRLASKELLLMAALGLLLLSAFAPRVLEEGVHPERGIYTAAIRGDSPLLPALESDARFLIDPSPSDETWAEADLRIQGGQVEYDAEDPQSASAAYQFELALRHWLDRSLETEADREAAFPVRVNAVFIPRERVQQEATPTEGQSAILAQPGVAEDPTNQLDVRPQELDPPFPLQGLLLTFAYVVPMSFVAQLYSGSLLDDRTGRRGLLLLTIPARGATLLWGKSLPYVMATLGIAAAITLFLGLGILAWVAAASFLLFLLSASLLFGLLARSPRELTFLVVSLTVLLNMFLFLPPLFPGLPSITFLSPVAVILATMEAEPVPLAHLLYSITPLLLLTTVNATLAAALYREETLFPPSALSRKVLDALARLVRRPSRLLWAAAFGVPVAFAAQLFLLVLAVSLDLRSALVAFLITSAFVEEGIKGVLVAARARPRYRDAALAGTGFFLAEKAALALALLGMGGLPLGPAALAAFGIAGNLLLVIAPWLLHVGTVAVTTLGLRRGRGRLGWAAASLLHSIYNLGLILYYLRGGL